MTHEAYDAALFQLYEESGSNINFMKKAWCNWSDGGSDGGLIGSEIICSGCVFDGVGDYTMVVEWWFNRDLLLGIWWIINKG